MPHSLGFGVSVPDAVGSIGLDVGMPNVRRPWQARLFDRFSPSGDLDLSDDDKKALFRQGLLQLAAGLQSSPNFGQGLTQGLLGGVTALNQGADAIADRRYKQELLKNRLEGPQGVQSTRIGDDGFYYTVDRTGKWTNSGIRAAPNTQLVQQPGNVPFLVTTSGGRAGNITELGAPAPAVPSFGSPAVAGAGQNRASVNIEGIPQEQQQRIAQGVAALQSAGFGQDVTDAFVQQQLSQPRTVIAPSAPRAQRIPTQAEVAGSEEAARQAAQIGALPARNALEVQAAGQKAAAESTARATVERQQEAITALPTVLNSTQQTIGLLDQALSHPGRTTATGLSATVDPRNYLPGTDASNFQVLLDQIKGQAFLQAFQSLRGSGAITEREGQAATNAIARLNASKQGDEAFEQALRELRAIAQKAQETAISKAQVAGPQAPSTATPRRLKFNPATGKLE